MGNSFRQPYGLPPSRSVVPALLLFPRICCASAREPYILLPQSCRRCSIGQQSTFSRGRDRARSGNGTLHVPFPSSQVAKSLPGSLQESTCSPLKPTPKKYYVFFWGPRGEEPRRLTFAVLPKSLSRAGFPCASSQRSKFRKPLRFSRLCFDARCSSSHKTRYAIFAGTLFF